ncbi:type 2 lanthipeptide synthetase LanM family protein (plasmid) [Priestia megaterium]|uniref:type 2 lanthipeptide synthetase LanM family protein n=1 Tax=Priestia megaterium TaxID=1404 RepID=UPI00351EEAC2
MNNTHLYRALTIAERKNEETNSTQKVDLNPAINFWQKILDDKTSTYIHQLLQKNYNIDTNFIKENFELQTHQTFNLNEDWFKYISNEFLIEGTLMHEKDEAFENMDLSSSMPFYAFFEPFLREFYYDFFHKQITNLNISLSYTCQNDIIKHFLNMLYSISHKTLILEVNSLSLMGKLNGNSSQERYQSFCKMLQRDDNYRDSLIVEYPVLFRLISTKIINLKKFLLELFTHYEQDKHLFSEKFNLNSNSPITRLHIGSGDSHKKGKTVTIIELENDEKIVYKPRCLSIDVEFQKFINWVNEKSTSTIKLKTITILDKSSYGWCEFVTYKSCENQQSVSNFYNRIGQLLGVLHVMNATDFHYENIISHGQFPVLIDLESLFHHTISPNHSLTESPVINKALRLINDSVLSTGLIPNRASKVDNEGKFDPSGIGDTANEQLLPFNVEVVTNEFTDRMKIEKKKGTLIPGLNNPRINGESINIGDYLDEITTGFSLTYSIFSTNKSELKSLINKFKNKEIRKIFRDTMKYSKLLNLSYHPDFLRNQIDREILINRLRVKEGEPIENAVSFEIKDMLDGDIPYFSSETNGTSIKSSDEQTLDDFYYKDGLSLSLEKIDRLDSYDLQNQLNIIEATIMAVYCDTEIKLLHLKKKKKIPLDHRDLVDKAEEIGEILLSNAIQHDNINNEELCWTSMVTKGINENNWVYSITGPGVYDGNTGIAIYFAYLWKVTQKSRYREAAYATINPIRKLLPELSKPKNVSLGGYLGISGVVYVLHHLGTVFNDDCLKKEAVEHAKLFEKFISEDSVYDLIGGSSGALMVLMNLYEEYREEWILLLAKKLVNHIVEHAKIQDKGGIAWHPQNTEHEPYIGFSHGNAGIASALARYYHYKPSADILEIIKQAIKYENKYFDENESNWFSSHLNKYVIAWCHGAPGILLSRCILKENNIALDDLDRDIKSAFETTINSNIGKNYSFCHGDLGLIDTLISASNKLGGYKEEEIDLFKEKILKQMFSSTDIQADINSVGLLNGIASIGYGLLRLAYPKQVPSVLILEKPII